MNLSGVGCIVAECWKRIPQHFEDVRCDVFQVMPNHVHGIITLPGRPRTPVGTRHAVSLQKTAHVSAFGRPVRRSLATIVGSFKSAVTNRAHIAGLVQGPVWQSRFHDRIIRDDIERFFIELYIELNPLLWELDPENSTRRPFSADEIRRLLESQHGLAAPVIEWFINEKIGERWASDAGDPT